MKKFMKKQKGFSLVELLIALLIMAIIAGTAITLFGGVLETSRGGADRETADAIKRAILTYMNAANDPKLSALNKDTPDDLVESLSKKITIKKSGATLSSDIDGTVGPTPDSKVLPGVYGPFLEKAAEPEQQDMTGWVININPDTQIITVIASDSPTISITP